MRSKDLIHLQIAIILVATLYGCNPAPSLTSNEPVAKSPTSTPAASTPAPIPVTITPALVVLPSLTPENPLLLKILSGHRGRVLEVAFSAQADILASSGQDLNIRIWDIQRGQELHTFRMNSVDMADIDISLNKNLLASAEAIWDLESLQEIHVLERGSPQPGSVAFSPDGAVLAVGLIDQHITLWDVSSGQPMLTFENLGEKRTKMIDFSPDGKMLAVGTLDGSVLLLDVPGGEIISILKNDGETDIHCVSFSPDGKYLATGGRLPAVVLWEVASGKLVRSFPLTDNSISVAFSPDGTIIAASGGYQHEVRLWEVRSGNLLESLVHTDHVSSVAFSPDGKLLAAACYDGNIFLWKILTNL